MGFFSLSFLKFKNNKLFNSLPCIERRSVSRDKAVGTVKGFLGCTTIQLAVKRKFKWIHISHRLLNAFNPNGNIFPYAL